MIYFVRHGQTDANMTKIIAGQQDVPLNQHGVEQAKETAEFLQDIKFDACYCSPLKRARQTCEQILKYHLGLSVVYDDRLKARDYGKVEGEPESAITFNRWKVGDDDKQTEDLAIETIMDLYQRVADCFDEIRDQYANKNILVIGHSCIGRVAAAYFNGMPTDYDFSTLKIPNAKVVMFDK